MSQGTVRKLRSREGLRPLKLWSWNHERRTLLLTAPAEGAAGQRGFSGVFKDLCSSDPRPSSLIHLNVWWKHWEDTDQLSTCNTNKLPWNNENYMCEPLFTETPNPDWQETRLSDTAATLQNPPQKDIWRPSRTTEQNITQSTHRGKVHLRRGWNSRKDLKQKQIQSVFSMNSFGSVCVVIINSGPAAVLWGTNTAKIKTKKISIKSHWFFNFLFIHYCVHY